MKSTNRLIVDLNRNKYHDILEEVITFAKNEEKKTIRIFVEGGRELFTVNAKIGNLYPDDLLRLSHDMCLFKSMSKIYLRNIWERNFRGIGEVDMILFLGSKFSDVDFIGYYLFPILDLPIRIIYFRKCSGKIDKYVTPKELLDFFGIEIKEPSGKEEEPTP